MDFLFGSQNKKEIREYEKIISEINRQAKTIKNLSDTSLKEKTREFKDRIQKGESLNDILPEAFAVVREASRRYLGIEQYPVQLMGAIAIHRGDVAEMKTGEGKTYTAPLAAYLNALTGKSVHIATSNDSLATRDAKLVTPLFEGLGLTVGVVTEERDIDYRKDIETRQTAYSCDITYGSGNAFAFDYLRDNTTHNVNNVVRGDKELGLIIIDEADQILVNDAVMPFKLSGTIRNPNDSALDRAMTSQQKETLEKEMLSLYSDANAFVHKLFKDSEHQRSFKTEEEMELYLGGNKKATEEANRKYSVLYCKSNAATLTERGWLEAFKYFEGTKIDNVVNRNSKIILDNDNFVEGKDYSLEDGRILLTLRGLEKAIKELPEVRNLNNLFYSSNEFSGLNKAIENALKAYFVLEKGKEYILDDVRDNRKGIVKKKVLLVSNGRTAEGRVYGDGLQQAIELKEKRLNERERIQIEMTHEHDELASISQKAFYSIYPKIAGMTGTSARELFEEIYGMSTISIPKNSEYDVSDDVIESIYSGREDKDTVLFETDKEKMEAVITSILESRRTGQPVLIGTTSVNESNKLYDELQRRGIPCEKLNAENANIDLENEIISRAGNKGSVTISTQMAGRGTDIKLGGNLDDFIEKVEKEKIDAMINNILKGKVVSEEELRKMRIGATKFIEDKKMDEVVEEAKLRLEETKKELVSVGGLKVIGYGHFSTKRDDDQLRGRAARQADPGVTEFYCSVRDLKQDLMVSRDKIKYLHKKGLTKGFPLSGEEVEQIISYSQDNMESLITSVIANTQESDYHLSRMRKKVYDQRMRILKGENPKENMEYIIESSTVNIIDRNLPSDTRNLSSRKKISKSGLNINNFIIDVEETFGIDLTTSFEEGKFKNLGELEKYVSSVAKERYGQLRKTNGDDKQDTLDRNSIIGTIDNAWLEFNENLEYIKFQNNMHNLAQNEEYDEIFAMKKGFNQAMIDAKINAVGKMLGKTSTKKRTVENEENIIDVDDSLNDYFVEEKRPSTNLSVRPAKIMTVLSEKIKLVRDKIKYQFELVPINESNEVDKVENIDFENSKEDYVPLESIFQDNVSSNTSKARK